MDQLISTSLSHTHYIIPGIDIVSVGKHVESIYRKLWCVLVEPIFCQLLVDTLFHTW